MHSIELIDLIYVCYLYQLKIMKWESPISFPIICHNIYLQNTKQTFTIYNFPVIQSVKQKNN